MINKGKQILRNLLDRRNKQHITSAAEFYDIEVSQIWPGCIEREKIRDLVKEEWQNIFKELGPPATKLEAVQYFSILRANVLDREYKGASIPSLCNVVKDGEDWVLKVLFSSGLVFCEIKWKIQEKD